MPQSPHDRAAEYHNLAAHAHSAAAASHGLVVGKGLPPAPPGSTDGQVVQKKISDVASFSFELLKGLAARLERVDYWSGKGSPK